MSKMVHPDRKKKEKVGKQNNGTVFDSDDKSNTPIDLTVSHTAMNDN